MVKIKVWQAQTSMFAPTRGFPKNCWPKPAHIYVIKKQKKKKNLAKTWQDVREDFSLQLVHLKDGSYQVLSFKLVRTVWTQNWLLLYSNDKKKNPKKTPKKSPLLLFSSHTKKWEITQDFWECMLTLCVCHTVVPNKVSSECHIDH